MALQQTVRRWSRVTAALAAVRFGFKRPRSAQSGAADWPRYVANQTRWVSTHRARPARKARRSGRHRKLPLLDQLGRNVGPPVMLAPGVCAFEEATGASAERKTVLLRLVEFLAPQATSSARSSSARSLRIRRAPTARRSYPGYRIGASNRHHPMGRRPSRAYRCISPSRLEVQSHCCCAALSKTEPRRVGPRRPVHQG